MAQARSELPADSDERSPEHPRHDVPNDASAKPSLGNVVRLERRSMPTWLKVILLLVHVLPLVLIAVSSGVLQLRHVARALFVLLALVAVAELVDNAILAPLYGRDACLLLLVRGMVLEPADEKMFQSWARRKFSRAQCLLIVSWAVWWNLYHRLVPWGLVPNVIVCALATRAFFRERREFEDIEGLELCLSWACAVGTASLNTVAFLAAPPARRSMYIELELLTDAELYSTFAVVGASLGLQPFELWTKLALLGANAVAVCVAGTVRAMYGQGWKALEVRRDMWLSVWTGFVLMHLLINRVIKPFWFNRQREVFVRPFDSRVE